MRANVTTKRSWRKKIPLFHKTSPSRKIQGFQGMTQQGSRHFNPRNNPKGKN
jgi:hypothetical protein